MKRKLTIIFSSFVFLLAFWFLCVDEAIFVDDCPDCSYQKMIFQVRVFTIPIYQRTEEHDSIVQKIAIDLGTECKHPNMTGYLKLRFWGLLIPEEYYPGTGSLSGGDDWYDDKARAIVKEMVKANPSLRDEFARKVLKEHDWKYLKAFVQRVVALKDGKSVPITASPPKPDS